MKAAYYEGDRKIGVADCVPVPFSEGEAQVKITCCGTDLHLLYGIMDHRMHLPQVFGHELSGSAPGAESMIKPRSLLA